jgi:Domain of unknown function (DUF4386)
MSVTARPSALGRATTDPMRSTSLTAGILYLITFVSIPTLMLYKPVQDDVATFLQGAGGEAGLRWGMLSEVIVGLAGIGTAVVLFPVLKRQSETVALGLVATRILEASLIFVGVASLLSLIGLRNGAAGAATAALVSNGHTLVGLYNGVFLVSQSLMPVLCDLLLGYVFYRSRLVPRVLPIVAFIGAPLLLASDLALFFGAYDRSSPLTAVAAVPVAVFELATGIWLLVKGFNPSSPVFAGPVVQEGSPSTTPVPSGGVPQH